MQQSNVKTGDDLESRLVDTLKIVHHKKSMLLGTDALSVNHVLDECGGFG